MTAEIAILNKSAVALAADSAVSIQQATSIKVYNSMNKLFTLSKYAPIGIMVYGTAELTGTPWETLIKLYRQSLDGKTFAQVSEYAQDFIEFVQKNPQYFPGNRDEDGTLIRIWHFYHAIHHIAIEAIHQMADGGVTIDRRATTQIYNRAIDQATQLLSSRESAKGLDETFATDVMNRISPMLDEIIHRVFDQHKFTPTQQNKLREIAKMLIYKAYFPPDSLSGIVVAGFGEDQIFPAMKSYVIDGIVGGRLRYTEHRTEEITAEMSASVHSFAQSETVGTFMNGVHPEYEDNVDEIISTIIDVYPEAVVSALPRLNSHEKRLFIGKMKKFGNKILEEVRKSLVNYSQKEYSSRILEAVQVLPRDELAAMAETLVNLTSFRQRISLNYETVGGPIDVAVVSKGDGFIWIKRKHYFEPELNHHFFSNYYRGRREVE
jgi:hypothetical protein